MQTEAPTWLAAGPTATVDLAGYQAHRLRGLVPEAALLCWLRDAADEQRRRPRRFAVGEPYLHYWTSDALRRHLARWARDESAAPVADEITSLRSLVQDFITLGINLRGRRIEEFRAGYLSAYRDPRRTPTEADRERHPRTLLAATLAALSWAGAALRPAIDALDAGPPPGGHAAGCLRFLAERYYTPERLESALALPLRVQELDA